MSQIQCQTLRQSHAGARPRSEGPLVWLSRLPWTIAETLLTWQRRANDRRRLASLDPRLLSDMGITEAEAAREAAIPFWRLK